MPKKRFTPEETIHKLREAEVMPGRSVARGRCLTTYRFKLLVRPNCIVNSDRYRHQVPQISTYPQTRKGMRYKYVRGIQPACSARVGLPRNLGCL